MIGRRRFLLPNIGLSSRLPCYSQLPSWRQFVLVRRASLRTFWAPGHSAQSEAPTNRGLFNTNVPMSRAAGVMLMRLGRFRCAA